ncbi:MAG: hypothetical protein KDC87_18095, partial [Planctomycetes bacterium]|nr:hypothetical protein [Planctomycetota bacterium]
MASPLLDLRPGEGRTLLLLGGHLFLVLAGNTLLATAAEALFLARYPYSWMPYTYLAGAFWTVVASFLYGKVKERLSPAGVTRVITAVSVAVLVLTLLVLLVWPAFGPFVLQMLTPAFGVLGGMESAALVARAVSTRQARRLYPAISGIGGVGATIGAYSVAVLSRSMSPLVLVGSTSVFLAAAMLLAVRVRGIEARRDRAKPAPWRDVLANRFSLLLISLVCVSGVLTTCVKFQLSACVKETFTEAQIKVYLGQLYGALNAASIVFGVLVTRLLIRWLGVSASLLVYPLLLLGCGIAGVASPGLVVTSTALFAERLFRQNLQRPLLNIAIMPLPEQLAARATIAIRGAVETPAIALTSIVLLLGASWIPWAAVSYVVAAAALLGVLCVLWARPCYRRELVEA